MWQYRPDRGPRRHDLVFVTRSAWCAALAMHGDLAVDPLVALWVDRGWPLICRRTMPDDMHGVPVGLPLPPFAGRQRLAFVVEPEDIVSVASPPALSAVSWTAPRAWRPTLNCLGELAAEHRVDVRVCGSLAWQALTGLAYVTAASDVDLLLHFTCDRDVHGLIAGIARIEVAAPMRLDGELVREDGAAVNWRELHSGASEVLVKTLVGVALIGAQSFVAGSPSS